jgi:hypothetical protein
LPGAATSSLAGDSAVATITFPAGFAFPFEGIQRTAIQVSTNGTAGFNTGNTSSGGYTPSFPNSYGGYANFAPYGCDLDSDNSTPAGAVWYALSSDAQGDFLVVEWKDWGW